MLRKLEYSKPDDIALAQAVEVRFIELCDSFLRIKGIELVPPDSLVSDLIRWRKLRVRHRHGDFRNTEAERKSTRAIAEWTLEINAMLRNQPIPKVDWGE